MTGDVLLRNATTAQLVAELTERLERGPSASDPPPLWCDSCRHFRPSETADDRYNPCSKRHAMEFRVPQPHESPEEFGYFRTDCEDRAERPEEIEPSVARTVAMRLNWDHPEYRQPPPPRGGKPRPA